MASNWLQQNFQEENDFSLESLKHQEFKAEKAMALNSKHKDNKNLLRLKFHRSAKPPFPPSHLSWSRAEKGPLWLHGYVGG